jgi:hypothetical protein
LLNVPAAHRLHPCVVAFHTYPIWHTHASICVWFVSAWCENAGHGVHAWSPASALYVLALHV